LFFGSSKTDYSVFPPIIDSVLKDENVHSFNFGVGGTSNPESYFLVEEFLKEIDSGALKIIVLEASPIRNMSLKNFKTTRNCYYHSLRGFRFSLGIIHQENYSRSQKNKLTFKYALHFLKDKINFSKLTYLRYPYQNAEVIEDDTYDGFTTTVIHQNSEHTENDYERKRRISKVIDTLQSKPTSTKLSVHAKRLNSIYKSCQEKGIQLFFLIQPKHYDYTYLNNLTNQLPENSMINLASVTQYPELYSQENSKDPGHLNAKGAIVFSKILGLEIKKRLDEPVQE
jgi:hypothetical protein